MTNHLKKSIRIFVASPGDVMNERARLASVVEQMNQGLANYLGVVFELKEWSQVAPEMGRGQQVIFDQLPVETWDVMIGILWLRYGSPSGGAHPNESGTHEEFRSAYECYQKTGKPRIMFYRCTRPPEDITKLNVDDFTKINAFFKEFEVGGKNLGFYKTYDTPENFERFVRDHLEKFLIEYSEKEKHQAITPEAMQVYAPKTPNNLPRRAAFFGRAKEMDVVQRALSPADRTWGVLVDGIGGIGKTALAIEAAHRAQDAGAFDAFVFITAKQSILKPSGIQELTPPARTLDDFLNETARLLGQPGIPKLEGASVGATPRARPEGDDKRRALLDVLRATRALLIYDNLETLSKEEQEQVADFLRELPQHCKAIITSRRRGGEGAVGLSIKELDWIAAREIIENEMVHDAGLANKLRRVESRWQELFDETNESPLALVHALDLMRVRATLSFDGVLSILRGTATGRNDDLMKFVYQESRKELTANDKTALGALSFFASSVTFEAWMQVADLSRNALEKTIDRLRALSLVDRVDGAGRKERYNCLSLTRRFARADLAKDFDIEHAVGVRFIRYWKDFAKRVSQSSNRNQQVYKQQIEDEWANLYEAADLLWEKARVRDNEIGNEEKMHEMLTVAYPLFPFLTAQDHWDESVQLNTRIYDALMILKRTEEAGLNAYHLCRGYFRRNKTSEALSWASKCVDAWSIGDISRYKARGAFVKGLIAYHNKDLNSAKKSFQDSVDSAHSQDTSIVIDALNQLGKLSHHDKRYNQAKEYFQKALETAKDPKDKRRRVESLCNLGMVAKDRRRFDDAYKCYDQALKITNPREPSSTAGVKLGRAQVYADEGYPDLAQKEAQEVLKIYEQLRHGDAVKVREFIQQMQNRKANRKVS